MIAKLLLRLSGHQCPRPRAESVPFARAVLCLDCDHITASRNDHCDHCGASGAALMPLWAKQLPLKPMGAALRADHTNYPTLRPALVILRAKYPQYCDPDIPK